MREKIINYFNDFLEDNPYHLKVLDKENKGSYTCVTLPYIKKYVLNNEYNYEKVESEIFKLIKEKKIKTLFCNDINKTVFVNFYLIHKCFFRVNVTQIFGQILHIFYY